MSTPIPHRHDWHRHPTHVAFVCSRCPASIRFMAGMTGSEATGFRLGTVGLYRLARGSIVVARDNWTISTNVALRRLTGKHMLECMKVAGPPLVQEG